MKLGLESFSSRNSGLDPVGVLGLASDLGLQGVLFELSPFNSFKDDELDRIKKTAQDKGLYIEFGMGSIIHRHPMAEKGRDLLADAGYDINISDAQIVIDHLKIAEKLGAPIMRCVGGNLFSRDEGYDMTALGDEVVAILREACKAAEDMGINIAMENHADFTVREYASIRTRINSPAYGFAVDCANLAFDLDEPVKLAGMMAPFALTTHYKNYRILRTKNGLALENCALGDGEIDIVAIAETLAAHNPDINLNIEIHSEWAPFTLNIFDDDFFTTHVSPPGEGLAWYLEKSWEKDLPETWPADIPAGEEAWKVELDHLKRSVAWAKESLSHLLSE